MKILNFHIERETSASSFRRSVEISCTPVSDRSERADLVAIGLDLDSVVVM